MIIQNYHITEIAKISPFVPNIWNETIQTIKWLSIQGIIMLFDVQPSN
jgi:hypothetical protein